MDIDMTLGKLEKLRKQKSMQSALELFGVTLVCSGVCWYFLLVTSGFCVLISEANSIAAVFQTWLRWILFGIESFAALVNPTIESIILSYSPLGYMGFILIICFNLIGILEVLTFISVVFYVALRKEINS